MPQRKGDLYTFVFAAVICLACALILSFSATALKPRQVANARLDILQNLMASVGFDIKELQKMAPDDVFALFDKEFEVIILDKNDQQSERGFMETELVKLGYPEEDLKSLGTGDLVTRFNGKLGLLSRKAGKKRAAYDPGYKVIYVHRTDGKPDAYVIPIKGYGLWDIIKGYVALDTDLNTIKGISFYEHKETPGLGARIVEDWFKDSFKGKKVLNERNELVSVKVAKGKSKGGDHEVDGISGATLTGDGINQFLLSDLQRYEPYFKTLRASRERSTP